MNLKLKIRRMEKSLSQKELASRVGLTSQSISEFERGTLKPSYASMQKIAKELNASVGHLFFDEG